MTLEKLYSDYSNNAGGKRRAEGILRQTHWLTSVVRFDPKTGKPIPMSLSMFLERTCRVDFDSDIKTCLKDRFWRIVSNSEQAVLRLIGNLSEEPRREHAFLPIRSVRELDTASFIALGRRPGRNIREKLSDKPYMLAVRRYQSVDTLENRLLKDYVKQIVEIMDLRKQCFSFEDDLYPKLRKWLASPDAQAISRWENLAPNNTLISHRDYRRIWDSWRWLNALDEDIDRDYADYTDRAKVFTYWTQLSELYRSERTQFVDMPMQVDWNRFRVNAWREIEPRRRKEICAHSSTPGALSAGSVCVDLAQIHPWYSSAEGESWPLPDSFVWQRWVSECEGEEYTDLSLFGSDAYWSNRDDVTTITLPDLFFSRGTDAGMLADAASSFADRIAERFETGSLAWLYPDCLNEFDLIHIRRAINARFKKAIPLPKSVAAVVEHVDYSTIRGSNYTVGVIEAVNGSKYITKLVAQHDVGLERALPQTKGYVWAREIPQKIEGSVNVERLSAGIVRYDQASGEWDDKYNPYGLIHAGADSVGPDVEFDDCDIVIVLNSSPVRGGAIALHLQQESNGRAIWRNKIPRLMTRLEVGDKGELQYYNFVGPRETIEPRRGVRQRINVEGDFLIPAGKLYFQLFQETNGVAGAEDEALEYVALLTSPDIPLKTDVLCKTILTYEYGSDSPYELTFKPYDDHVSPIRVEWAPKSAIPHEDIPGPVFVALSSWADLRNQYSPKDGRASDVVDWAIDSAAWLVSRFGRKPLVGKIETEWRTDRFGTHWADAITGRGESFRLYENNFAGQEDCLSLEVGDKAYFFASGGRGKPKGFHVSKTYAGSIMSFAAERGRYLAPESNAFMRGIENANRDIDKLLEDVKNKSHYPFMSVWAEGRSIRDEDCPKAFKQECAVMVDCLIDLYRQDELPEGVKKEILFLMCCLGDDMPEELSVDLGNWASEKETMFVARACGFALGSAKKDWQKAMLKWIISTGGEYGLRILSNAAWRNPVFVDSLEIEDVETIFSHLSKELDEVRYELNWPTGQREARYGDIVKYLELVLALLRTRNSNSQTLRQYTQPWQPRMQKLASCIEEIASDNRLRKAATKSRIQLDLPSRLDDEKTLPDLIYALNIYLSGDDRFNAIRILGVHEQED